MLDQLKNSGLVQPFAFIDGDFVSAETGETYSVTNPANGQRIADVASCSAVETKRAIEVAYDAFSTWSRLAASKRCKMIRALRDSILDNRDDLAALLTLEQGKPLKEAIGEILYGASYLEWFSEEGKRSYGDVFPSVSDDARLLAIKQPVGVVACITPWNFPSAMLTRKIAPALAAGCTVVCKPANETPLSALAVAKLAKDVGIPDGVLNVISGKTEEIGTELTTNPLVRKLSFTGSTSVGKKLASDCAGTLKKLSLELGGNAPFIVFENADIDLAVNGLISNKFRNAGQTCISANRVLVDEKILETFQTSLIEAMKSLTVGDGFEPSVNVGPLISPIAVQKVMSLLEDAKFNGADVWQANQNVSLGENFVSPALAICRNLNMRLFEEEIFGPIVAIYPFKKEDEAISIANQTNMGLAAYIYTQDLSQIWRVTEAIEAGMVAVNDANISSEVIPFGGIKESGHGREGSKYGLSEYLELKHIKFGGLSLKPV